MNQRDLLPYDLALLIARHGERRVIAELAKTLLMPSTQLEDMLAKTESLVSKASQKKKGKDSVGVLEEICAKHPERAKRLRTLHARYQSKSFLPELKDVKRFLERSGDVGSLKSRLDATSKVLHRLAEVPLDVLDELASMPEQSGYSSLGAISDEILRRSR